MKSRSCGRGVAYWCAADAGAIAVAITYPDWLMPVVTWLALVAMLVCAGLITVRQRI